MHLQVSTVAVLFFSVITVLTTQLSEVDAHSWMDCVDWRPNDPSAKEPWGANDGKCFGYARRYPKDAAFGTLDDANPSRHYQQDDSNPLPCSDGKHGKEVGSDETLASPPSEAYNTGNSKWGPMTYTKVGSTLCIRWPAKNHADSSEGNTKVEINISKNKDGPDPTQKELLQNTAVQLDYKNCKKSSDPDKWPCGGCFTVPVRASGRYLLQWRWMLNPGEWYTSCADIEIGGGNDVSSNSKKPSKNNANSDDGDN
ncbi:hypothetical protein BGZ49_000580 [Haplosporangium sp. Z 27]|nr:hypothetical protein BGZ49_000580 [Haplosporangium sp. Z 27]